MIVAMNRSGDAAILKTKDIEMFAKPRMKKTRVLKRSPPPLRKNRSSKARKNTSESEALEPSKM
jgi:hypothetical protein